MEIIKVEIKEENSNCSFFMTVCEGKSYTAKSGSISNSSSVGFFFTDLNFVMALLTLSESLTTLSIFLSCLEFCSNAV